MPQRFGCCGLGSRGKRSLNLKIQVEVKRCPRTRNYFLHHIPWLKPCGKSTLGMGIHTGLGGSLNYSLEKYVW